MDWFMHRFQRVLYLALVLAVICVPLKASIPQFSARTMDGDSISDDSLRGRVVLLQFWTTWCPVCRRDQAAVNDLVRRYGDRGLTVLAIDVGEPENVVRDYLAANPRSCPVVLNSAVNLASKFGVHGYPTYIALDAQGKVAGTQSGSGGEASLLRLLARAGLTSRPGMAKTEARSQRSDDGPLMISIPAGSASVAPSKPRAKTIFILANGERLESDEYTIDSSGIVVTADGKKRNIALSELNVNATKAANKERGIELAIPANRSEIVLSF
jgi:thiol-disulfide isomerase/thioredoxin